jgi:hypothetical protein
MRLTVDCWIESKVRVHGLNTYGGAIDTDGWIYPGQEYDVDFSYELTLSKHWAIACDHIFVYQTPVKFKGYLERIKTEQLADLNDSWVAVFQLAPASEYNRGLFYYCRMNQIYWVEGSFCIVLIISRISSLSYLIRSLCKFLFTLKTGN